MIRLLLPLPLLLLAAAVEVPFDASAESFADAAACKARLAALAHDAGGDGRYEAVEGPYQVAIGDIRIHMVRAEGGGHRITEHRCLAEKLSARSWSHSMADDDQPEFTVESVARSAPWLHKQRTKQ